MPKGIFIVFEGNNGAGKTTIINNLIKKIQTNSDIVSNIDKKDIYQWNLYKFPNRSTILGKKIDDFLKNKLKLSSKEVELKFFAENRKEFQNEMEYILNKGYNVICDRYIYSSMAYTITSQTIDIINKKSVDLLSIDNILSYDRNFIKPNYVFLIKGDFLFLRNEEKEKYHKNKLYNELLLNNYIISIQKTSTDFAIIDNIYGELDKTTNIIINIINRLITKNNIF